MKMTAERIAAARLRCEAATPGGYAVVRSGTGPLGWSVGAGITDGKPRWQIAGTCREDDALAISGALTDLPLALDDLEAALAVVEAARRVAKRLCDGTWKSTETCDGCLQAGLCEAQSLYVALAALGEE